MNLTQTAGRSHSKLTDLENGFWLAMKNPKFQGEWNIYRREVLAAAAATVSEPTEKPVGIERTFRLVDRDFVARFQIAVVNRSQPAPAIALGVIHFRDTREESAPFYQIYFDESARFGTDPINLSKAHLSSSSDLLDLFDSMAEAAVGKYFVLDE